MSEIPKLLALLKQYNEAYRAGHPIVSDKEYDELVDLLRILDPKNPWFAGIEPAPIANKGRKVKLPTPMKSLNKAKSLAEVQQWLKSLAIPDTAMLVITPKFDGVSWLHEEKTDRTYSRGGADNEGQDCTAHYLEGGFCKHKDWNVAEAPEYTYGELVFYRYNWEENFVGRVSSTGDKYKSPRNTIAGFINRNEPTPLIRHASFYRYGVGETDLDKFNRYSELYEELAEVFSQNLLYHVIPANSLNEKSLDNLFRDWSRHFFIDGLVIYLDDIALWKVIGRQQTTGNPLYAIAYKHPDFTDRFITTVKKVDWKVSKAGALKPVVCMDAVDTGDCIMENPTGYNAKYIFENGIGPGAEIEVTRSGGVIPKILATLKEATDTAMMEQRDELLYCPDCQSPTTWNDSKVELVCTNPDCPGRRMAKIVFFYKTLEAEQMGEETIAKMFHEGHDTLKRILDITFDELLRIDGFGEGIANVILSANKKIREGVEITKLMHASDCFEGIGQVKAKTILSELPPDDYNAFIGGFVETREGFDQSEQFLALPKTMQSFLKGIEPFYKFCLDNDLTTLPMQQEVEVVGDKYAGYKVCFSGVRDKLLENEIASQGGEIVSGVSKKTTHLIVADKGAASSKIKKAESLLIPIFTFEEFKSL